MTKKAVILAGGQGSRMQKTSDRDLHLDAETEALADKGLKGLIPINGQPFLDYVVGRLFQVGIEAACLVVPPDSDELRDYTQDVAERSGREVTWAVQEEPRGTADALMSARDFVEGEDFIMSNCDNVYPTDALAKLAERPPGQSAVMSFDRDQLVEQSNFGEDRVRRFAVVADEGGELEQIVEKPEHPEEYERDGHLWLSMNLFRFAPSIFDACARIEPHPERGELELTTAVLRLAREQSIAVQHHRGGVIDMTCREDIPPVREMLKDVSPGF